MLNEIQENLRNHKFRTVLKTLSDRASDLPDSEFYDIVGETFIFDPELFMTKLYKDFMKKMGKMIGIQKRKEMERYIIEKYCLGEEEKIIYELDGRIVQHEEGYLTSPTTERKAVRISIKPADIFITHNKIIGHGQLKASGGEKTGYISSEFSWGRSKQKERKEALIKSSPVFGYQFPTKIPKSLFRTKHIVGYSVNIYEPKYTISIKPTDKSKRSEHVSNIFDILRKDVDEVLAIIQEAYEKEILEKNTQIFSILSSLFITGGKILNLKLEDLTHFSDSDKIKIIVEMYKLDPEYFMASIYPKMVSWDFPSFLTIREALFELLRKEGASI